MPTKGDDDDRIDDWEDGPETIIDLDPSDVSEIEEGERTRPHDATKLPGFDIGRRGGIDEAIAAMGLVLRRSSSSTPAEIDGFGELVRDQVELTRLARSAEQTSES